MYQKILVPIDVAHIAEGKTSIEIAMNNLGEGGSILLLYVVQEIPDWAAASLPKGIMDSSIRDAQAALEKVAAEYESATEVEIREGHSYQTILDFAEERQVDLVVIASHQPGLKDYYLGSTAAKVVRHATCSVHVVR
ncbi:MAG: universal stress protein [Gammaproteobacteria bacterium]|nr:universal stress protein [Gammaproteobacteria bacterium]